MCTSCPLYEYLPEGCTPVPGLGSGSIFIVGLYPNNDAVILGEPFDQIEIEILKNLLGSLDRFYLTNLIKCPSKSHAKRYLNPCLTHFYAEYNWLKPKLMIAVGEQTKRILDELMLNCAIPHIPSLHKILNGSKADMETFSSNLQGWIEAIE